MESNKRADDLAERLAEEFEACLQRHVEQSAKTVARLKHRTIVSQDYYTEHGVRISPK